MEIKREGWTYVLAVVTKYTLFTQTLNTLTKCIFTQLLLRVQYCQSGVVQTERRLISSSAKAAVCVMEIKLQAKNLKFFMYEYIGG
jgi:hypothetical protein